MVETRRAASPSADELLLRLAHKTCPTTCAIARAAAFGDAARRVSTLGPFRLRSRKAAPSASIFAVLCSFQPLARLHSIRIALIAPHTRYETASTGSIRNASGVKLVSPGQRDRGSFLLVAPEVIKGARRCVFSRPWPSGVRRRWRVSQSAASPILPNRLERS